MKTEAIAVKPHLVEDETQALLKWVDALSGTEETLFGQAQQIATRLGAHYRPDGLTEVGFWVPNLNIEIIQSENSIFLEVLTPLDPIDFQAVEQQIKWRVDRVPLIHHGEYAWGVIDGMQPGRRHQAGSFYWLRYIDFQRQSHVIRDVLAHSLPYGVFAPAELYDLDSLQQNRSDRAYFQRTGVAAKLAPGRLASALAADNPDGIIPRVPAPVCILEVHVGTASEAGTLEGLTQRYQRIATKLQANEPLTPGEQNFIGYDAVELLPIEPTIEYRGQYGDTSNHFFELPEDPEVDPAAEAEADPMSWPQEMTVTLRKPNTQNWGYDVPILGSAATNPAQLSSLRPDELVDFIATLHNFPTGPIQVIYDLVYGHASNQSVELINQQYFKGPNMYGQDLNHQLPEVRAILLEMQRRKFNTGADGIRIDGGQDFKFFNPRSGRVEYDDEYLLAMSDVVQEINGYQRLPFTIFEDGRPWPQEGWEETSRYLELIELMPESYQWGPLIFAHNTPVLDGFWAQKWTRVSEVMVQGENWITGCGNHDTVRRGNQIHRSGDINFHLGDTLADILKNAYDNPATQLWVYCFSPGLPMDFLNALMRGAWLFFRNTDDIYGVKVVTEETGFLDWQVTPPLYAQSEVFPQLKALGFEQYTELYEFAKTLEQTMLKLDYDLEMVAIACQQHFAEQASATVDPGTAPSAAYAQFISEIDVAKLQTFANAFMEDAHDFSKVVYWEDKLDPEQVAFNLALRRYRFQHDWLRRNLDPSDRFNRISDDDKTLFYGLRTHPEDPSQAVVMVAHMGGEPSTVTLADWLQLDLSEWQIALKTPGLELGSDPEDWRTFELKNSQALLLEKVTKEEVVEHG